MNQAVFPTVWKASSLSKTWWGSQWTSATPSGQNYTPETNDHTLIQFSAKEHNLWVVGPVWRSQSRYTFTKNESNNAALNRPEAIKIVNKIFRYFMNLHWSTAMKHSKWACHHMDFFRGILHRIILSGIWTAHILIWNVARPSCQLPEEIAFSWYHCTKKEKLRVTLKRRRGRKMGSNCGSHYWREKGQCRHYSKMGGIYIWVEYFIFLVFN